MDLAIEVINVGALQLVEVFQLLSITELHIVIFPAEQFLRNSAFMIGWRVNGLSPASPLVVEVENLLPPQSISLRLIGQI